MTKETAEKLMLWAETYNDPKYFQEDPIAFPRELVHRSATTKDIEIAALFASHFAWGRREMIVRDCERLFDHMEWKPLDYVMSGDWRDDDASIHRTIKWSDVAGICRRLKEWYSWHETIENLSDDEMRVTLFRSKEDPKAPNKKISMMRRWMVRCDGKVDLGIWKASSPKDLIVPLDVHVYTQASDLGLTRRKQKDRATAVQITEAFKELWPDDPLLGDFALFGYGVTH